MSATQNFEYRKAVDDELSRVVEELYAVHGGDTAYLAWLELQNPEQAKQLAEMPGAIQRAVSFALPVSVVRAYVGLYLAAHRLTYATWAAREEIGQQFLAGLATSNWRM